MKLPFQELHRFISWKDRFLRDYEKIRQSDLSFVKKELESLTGEVPENRLLFAIRAMYVGGMEERVEDPEVRAWTNWAGVKTFKTFNGFPNLTDAELTFVFYGIGKLFVPLLLHQRGVKSEAFKALSREEQEEAVFEELDTIWETQLTLLLQALEFLDIKSITK